MKRSTFGEVDTLWGQQGLDLHGIFIEPRQFGHGWRSRLNMRPSGRCWVGVGGARHRWTDRTRLMEEHMFIAIAHFPEIPTEREVQFEAWFAWSNDLLRAIDGLQGRRLLRAADGTYTALVEHQSAETFAAMHLTEVASLVHARLGQVLHGEPVATKYEVVADLARSGSCCGGGSGHGRQDGHGQVASGVGPRLQVAGGCCQGA